MVKEKSKVKLFLKFSAPIFSAVRSVLIQSTRSFRDGGTTSFAALRFWLVSWHGRLPLVLRLGSCAVHIFDLPHLFPLPKERTSPCAFLDLRKRLHQSSRRLMTRRGECFSFSRGRRRNIPHVSSSTYDWIGAGVFANPETRMARSSPWGEETGEGGRKCERHKIPAGAPAANDRA